MFRRTIVLMLCTFVFAGTISSTAAAGDHVYLDDYAALGDSYSSGVGTREYWDTPCKRSIYSYAGRLFYGGAWPRSTNLSFTDVTCGGATTADVLATQVYSIHPPSTVPGFDPVGTNYVTISIGGNDAGFSSVVTQCAKPWPTTCWGDIDKAQGFIRDVLPARLADVYARIRQAAPNAVVIVVGYPHLFGPKECNGAVRISLGEQKRLNQTGDVLRDVIRTVVATFPRFVFVDPTAAFSGHAICAGSNAWLNGLSNPTSESFHPNRTGYALGYLPLVRSAIATNP